MGIVIVAAAAGICILFADVLKGGDQRLRLASVAVAFVALAAVILLEPLAWKFAAAMVLSVWFTLNVARVLFMLDREHE